MSNKKSIEVNVKLSSRRLAELALVSVETGNSVETVLGDILEQQSKGSVYKAVKKEIKDNEENLEVDFDEGTLVMLAEQSLSSSLDVNSIIVEALTLAIEDSELMKKFKAEGSMILPKSDKDA